MAYDPKGTSESAFDDSKEDGPKSSNEAEEAMKAARQMVAKGLESLQKDLDKIEQMVAQNRDRAFQVYKQEIEKAGCNFKSPLKRHCNPDQQGAG